jgi:hypothetical protein
MTLLSFFKPSAMAFDPARPIFIPCILILFCLSFAQPPVHLCPSARQSVEALCHTVNVKLVFLCRDSMWYVDFAEPSPQIRKINNMDSAYFPVISSDGRWITFQTGSDAEGPQPQSAKSGRIWFRELAAGGTPVKVADTGYVPRFVQNTPADEPEIVYDTSVDCPGGICYNAGATMKRKIVDKIPQAAQIVCAGGSYYGGLSWDERYLCTGWPGGPNAYLLDMRGDAAGPRPVHSIHVKKTATGADTSVALVACNLSRSASVFFPDNTLYIDFSSLAIKNAGCFHPLLGEWGVHGKLFISRYDGEDLRVFDMPSDHPLVSEEAARGGGEPVSEAWEYPEWSNHPYYAAAALYVQRVFAVDGTWETTDNIEALYLVDLKDSVFLRLLETSDTSFASTTNLASPFLWVEKTPAFREDSTWLGTTIWQRAGQGVLPGGKGPPESRGRRTLLPEGDATVSVYSALGKKIGEMKPSKGGRPLSDNAFNYPSSGIYLLKSDSKERSGRIGKRFVLR